MHPHPHRDNLHRLDGLEPHEQAQLLARFTAQARVLRLSLLEAHEANRDLADALERALERMLDAECERERNDAQHGLEQALLATRAASLTLAAGLGEFDMDGPFGQIRMPVLTAVLSAN